MAKVFNEKTIFIWNDSTIGAPEQIVDMLIRAGFEGALLHETNLTGWRKSSRIALVNALKEAGLRVYASAAVYGYSPTVEGQRAAALVEEYVLDGMIFDVESGQYETSTSAPTLTRDLFIAYKAGTSKPSAFCWWPFFEDPYDGVPQYHPVAVLKAAMKLADYGMPMAYWDGGNTPAAAVRYLENAWKQWREVTDKPLVIAGRAYNDQFATAKGDAVLAYEARARALGACGISWWDMDKAVHIQDVWEALKATPKWLANEPTEPEPEIPGGGNMWESNALIVALEAAGSAPAPKTVDWAALKAAGVHAVILRAGTSSQDLNYDQPDAGYIHDPDFPAWFEAATAAGLRVLIDYDFCPVLDSVNSYNGSVTLRHINYLLSGGKQPKAGGALILNCERHQWRESGKIKTCTAVNYGKDVKAVFEAIWDAHHLVPGLRSGRWFLETPDDDGNKYRDQFAFSDKGEGTVPWILTHLQKNNVTVTGDLHSVIAGVPDPATTYITLNPGTPQERQELMQSYYLYYGNTTKWSGWELAWIYHEAVKDSVGQPAKFRLIVWNGDPKAFDLYFNFPDESVPADTTPPSIPQGLAAQVSGSTVGLSWTPSTDNVEVVGYIVYRDGVVVGSPSGPYFTDSGVPLGTHSYRVQSVDAAGNASDSSAPISVTIEGAPPVGDLAPVLAALARIESAQAGLRQTIDAIAGEVTEIRSHFKP